MSKPTRDAAIVAALATIAADGLLAIPTETVWGLAANARSERALARLRAWKGRDEHKPVSLLTSGAERVAAVGGAVDAAARELVDAFWPGPLTLVLPCTRGLAAGVARSDGAVGFRCSSHPWVASLVAAAEDAGVGPLTATSLNRSGEPPAANFEAARALCETSEAAGGIPLSAALPAASVPDAFGEAPSTVVDLTGDLPAMLREGAISAAQLAPVLGVAIATLVTPAAGASGAAGAIGV